jgi:chromate reductase
MPKIVLMSGSIRRESADSAVIATIRRIIQDRDDRIEVSVVSPRDFPLFDEDVERAGHPAALRAARETVAGADALIVSTPAYNGYPSGVLKNALDWLSRPGGASPLTGRAVAVVSASPGRAGGANAVPHLRQILANCGAEVLAHEPVSVGDAVALRTAEGVYGDPDVLARLSGLVDAVLDRVAGPAAVPAL